MVCRQWCFVAPLFDQRSWFFNFTPILHGIWPIQEIVKHIKWAMGIGDIKIKMFVKIQWEGGKLKDVMFVPTLEKNLFSILAIAHKDIDVLYTKIGCRICTKEK
jgi:hypothetical protein